MKSASKADSISKKSRGHAQASLVKRAIRLKAITAIRIASKASNAETHQKSLINAVSVQPCKSFGIFTGTTETTLTTEVSNLHK